MLSKKAAGLIGLGATVAGTAGSQMTSASLVNLMKNGNERNDHLQKIRSARNIAAAKNIVKRMCEVLPAGDRGKVFEKLNDIIKGLDINSKDSRISDGGVALRELIDSIFEVAKAKNVDGSEIIKKLMDDVKIEIEMFVPGDDISEATGMFTAPPVLKREVEKFKNTIYFQRLFNSDLSDSDTKLFDNLISDAMADDYYEDLLKMEDKAQLANMSNEDLTDTSNIKNDVNEPSLDSKSANSSFDDSIKSQDLNDLTEAVFGDFGDNGIYENKENRIEEINEKDLEALKRGEFNQYLSGKTFFEQGINIDHFYEKVLNSSGLTENEFLTLQKEDKDFLKNFGLNYNEVVTDRLEDSVKQRLLIYLQEKEQSRIEDYYSNSLQGRKVVLNDLGYKDIFSQNKEILYKGVKIGVDKISKYGVGLITANPALAFMAGILADASIDYLMDELDTRFNKVHDTKHPELEKEREVFTQKLKAEALNSIKGKFKGVVLKSFLDIFSDLSEDDIDKMPDSSVIEEAMKKKNELVSGVSKALASSFEVKSESLKKFLDGQIKKWGTKGLEESIKYAYKTYKAHKESNAKVNP